MIRPSFRDPAGCTWVGPDVVHRAAWDEAPGTPEAQEALETLIRQFQAEGKWIAAKPIDPSTLPAYLQGECPLPKRAWEHPRVFFPSYAHEWSPGMVHSAAALTLELNERLLEIGWELKDATPSNILFEGPNPIFVDHLSPAPRTPGQMGWVAYGQFIRTFLVPLCLHRLNRLPLSWIYLACRDGVAPEDAIRQLSLLNQFRPSVFSLITLPALLSRRQGSKPTMSLSAWERGDEPTGRAITAYLLKGLRQRLANWVQKKVEPTIWYLYDQSVESYTTEGLRSKEAFILQVLDTCQPKNVIDLGCNTGRYSKLASKFGSRVIAVDGDPACIDRSWQDSRTKGLDVLPLVTDLGRPSPTLGWENAEEASFLERTKGRFDMVFALALIHHLLVRERIPLDRIIAHLARQTTNWAIIEWIPPSDIQFQRLSGPNNDDYSTLSIEHFEITITKFFKIHQVISIIGCTRVLYHLEKIV